MNTNSINTNPMNTNPINTNPMNANPINANSINTNSINATGIQNNANNIDNSKTYISSLCNNNSLKRKQFVGHDVTVNRKQKNIIINVSPHNAPQFKHSNQQNIFTKSGISNSDSFDYHPHDVMRKDQTPHSSPDTSAADTEVINTPHDLEAFFKSLQISKLKNGRPPNI
ncbi:hypothetical protein TRFO_37721 [Tritrichomonas foetus]|uniref:Uncharacterized protein n=1 Tax=Tritrichomonas foetus TaxID=1144522 RepID=A0A1J4JBV2_9EUKA|nr:hypothetical protein TRFO_37721 [Tritrichomonas foetus]|eukprot:OHS96137.1 hypothetical protein TRFO_37721 [Tritrichomonas foetus]